MEDSTPKKSPFVLRDTHDAKDPREMSLNDYLRLTQEAEKGDPDAIKALDAINPLMKQMLDDSQETFRAIGDSIQKKLEEAFAPAVEAFKAISEGWLKEINKAFEGIREFLEQFRQMDEAVGEYIHGEGIFDHTYPSFDEANDCWILSRDDGAQFKFYMKDGKVHRFGIEYGFDVNKGDLQVAIRKLTKPIKQEQRGGKKRGSKEATITDYLHIKRAWDIAKDNGMSASDFCARMKIAEGKRKAALRYAKKALQ